MQERLEQEEETPRNDADLSFDDVNSSSRLLPDDRELQINNEMGQPQNEENAGSLRVQYLVSLAAVLGGMTMGTTIGSFRKIMTFKHLHLIEHSNVSSKFD